MKIYFTLLVTLFLFVSIVECADKELEVKKGPGNVLGQNNPLRSNQNNHSNEKTGGSDSDLGSKKVDPLNKEKEPVADSKQGVQDVNLSEKDHTKQVAHKEAENDQTDARISKPVKPGDKKESINNGSGSKDVAKENVLPATTTGSFLGEECDPSNQCVDDANALVACLRVPGNESPELSLLIQNIGNSSLSVKIAAPDFVLLEKTEVQLLEKKGTEVRVSITGGKTNKPISLNAGNGDCILDFRNPIAHNVKETDSTSRFTNTNLFRRTPFLGFVFLAALLAIASIPVCVSFRRKRFQSNANISKYQKLEMELPVSGEVQTEPEQKDGSGWDDSWSDNWDDVEAPKTPSLPVTPSLSAKSFTSRRITKEGWKD